MLSSFAESFIQRLCGRYLKNFNTNNVNISLTGTITLTNIELNTNELDEFQLPYEVKHAFIGSLIIDLPIVLNGNFDIKIFDGFLLLAKNERYNIENISLDNNIILMKALQTWLGFLYTTFQDTSNIFENEKNEKPKIISENDLEYTIKLIDKLIVHIERMHIRLEEEFYSHIPCGLGNEYYSFGIIIESVKIFQPTNNDITNKYPLNYFHNPINYSNTSLLINKIIDITNLSIYSDRLENSLLFDLLNKQFTLEFIKSIYQTRLNKLILTPWSFTFIISFIYQKMSSIFGPIKLNILLNNINIIINDEQLLFLNKLLNTIIEYPRK